MKHVNFLSRGDKKILALEKTRVFTVLYGIVLIGIIIGISSGIFALRFYMQGKVKAAGDQLRKARLDPALSRFYVLRADIQKTNKILEDILAHKQKERAASDHMKLLEHWAPEEIQLLDFMLESNGRALLAGFAPTRESFLAFLKNIKDSDKVARIETPIEPILKPTDIRFSLNFTFR